MAQGRSRSNNLVVPQARQALEQLKMEFLKTDTWAATHPVKPVLWEVTSRSVWYSKLNSNFRVLDAHCNFFS